MRGKRMVVVFMIFVMGLSTGAIAGEKASSQYTEQKKEKATPKAPKSNNTASKPMQPFQPSKEVSADSVISLPTDI